MRDDGFVLAISFVNGHGCEAHVSARLTDIAFDGQGIAELRGRDVRDMDISAQTCLLETSGCNGHTARPVHNGG